MAAVVRDQVPSGGASAIGFLSIDTNSQQYIINGIEAPPGPTAKIFILQAIGDISITHEAVSANAEDRIYFPSGSQFTLYSGQSLLFIYNPSVSRWIGVIAGNQL